VNGASTALELSLSAVLRALNNLGVPHMLTGSLAVSVHALPRATKDADVVVQAEEFDPVGLAAALGKDFRLEPQMMFETVTMTPRHVLEHVGSGFVVELFVRTADPHDLARFERRRPIELFGVATTVASPEDVVVTKLRWSRLASRRKDLDDVRNVLAVQAGRLDLEYIRRWCAQHGTGDLLARLLLEAT
jgi:hypothetical protein